MHVATRNMHVARFFSAKWTLVLNPSDLEEIIHIEHAYCD